MSNENFTFETSDSITFTISKNVCRLFTTLENLVIDCQNSGEPENKIPLPEISSVVLQQCLDYAKLYTENHGVKQLTEEERQDKTKYLTVNEWEKEFLSKFNHTQLFDLILAANYLDNKHLLECACKTAAKDMTTKTDEEIRQMWGVQNDFTPEEQLLYEEEKKWCLE